MNDNQRAFLSSTASHDRTKAKVVGDLRVCDPVVIGLLTTCLAGLTDNPVETLHTLASDIDCGSVVALNTIHSIVAMAGLFLSEAIEPRVRAEVGLRAESEP